jgi:hypothetical protein
VSQHSMSDILKIVLELSGAYDLAEQLWGEDRYQLSYEITNSDDYYAEAVANSAASTTPIVRLSTKILSSELVGKPGCLCALLAHEVGHLDHIYRVVHGRAPQSELDHEFDREAIADDFVVLPQV